MWTSGCALRLRLLSKATLACARLVEKAPHSQTTRCTQCTTYRGQLRVMKARKFQNDMAGECECMQAHAK